MTLEEIEEELPNGFHDAQIRRIEVDYESRIARLNVVFPGDNSRSAIVTMRGLQFLTVDPPDKNYAFAEAKPLWIDAGPGQPPNSAVELPPLADGAFLHWFYVNNWNAFLRVSALDAELEWVGTG